MNLDQVNELLVECEQVGGNRSVLFPLIEDRLADFGEKELFGVGEFLFFEERYLKGLRHMHEQNIHGHVLDIGCQIGFQSELFLEENSYTGVDVISHRFFNQDQKNVSYHIGSFPNQISYDVENHIVFSIMSLGYFSVQGKDGKTLIDVKDKGYLDVFVNALRHCKHLYIATTKELLHRLKEEFPNYVLLDEVLIKGNKFIKESSFDMYYFGR